MYPVYWSWVAWREYQAASRSARRIEDVLADMSSESRPKERTVVGTDGSRRTHLRSIGR
jgi:hypothetical protein